VDGDIRGKRASAKSSTAKFEAAQARVRAFSSNSATWCPTCKAQEPIIDSLASGQRTRIS